MSIGTKSILFGAHAFWLHPFFVAEAWRQLYGFPWDVRLWVAFFVHDLGYWKATDLEGPEGEKHVYAGARILSWLFGDEWGEFCRRHSRCWAKKQGCKVSRLAAADKLAFVMTPWWLYLPMVSATGELTEYMTVSRQRHTGDCSFAESELLLLSSGDARSWLSGLHAYTRRWVEGNKDHCLRVDEICVMSSRLRSRSQRASEVRGFVGQPKA